MLKRTKMLPICLGLMLGSIIGLTGCSSNKNVDAYEGFTDAQIFKKAHKNMSKGKVVKATEDLEALEAHYPFGEYADKAQLGLLYLYLDDEQTASALSSAERFIQIHPRHKHIDYAYYMKGMAHYQQSMGYFDRWFPMEREDREQTYALKAFAAFGDLIRRYPDSKYAPDAQKRMIYLRNKMAEHEYMVAKFYMKRKSYLAAANRVLGIIEQYDGAPIMPSALHLLSQAYHQLELVGLEHQVKSMLRENFPDFVPSKNSEIVNVVHHKQRGKSKGLKSTQKGNRNWNMEFQKN